MHPPMHPIQRIILNVWADAVSRRYVCRECGHPTWQHHLMWEISSRCEAPDDNHPFNSFVDWSDLTQFYYQCKCPAFKWQYTQGTLF